MYPAAHIVKETFAGTKINGRKDWNKYTIDLAKAQIRIAFEQAEKEVLDLHQRTSEDIKTAGISRNSYYKYKAELKEAAEQ